ncbi:ABC transporter permease [Roseinatronobacter sp. S2]|uniref:ABC transporter permease n=1 Tax=Roseinatronobacter sp. S2 TaxID=3035471 RepID=UPI002410B5D7|nr:ABC transporter permease [Roseinatronobacter sp. S2]WFE74771.1 ABC transporter permease [Roseinatronobacter sp. S2]
MSNLTDAKDKTAAAGPGGVVGAFPPGGATAVTSPAATLPAEDELVLASQFKLMWWKFRRHKLALVGGVVTILIYLVAIFAEFLAPYAPNVHSTQHTYAPPQALNLFVQTDEGRQFLPHVNGYTVEIDPVALRRTFVIDETQIIPVGLFVKSEPYLLAGFIPLQRKLFGPVTMGERIYLFGADRLGRDVLSRTIHGTRVSMSIGLVGVALSLFLGVLLGGLAGFYGGWIDTAQQRLGEFLESIPSIPLWMGLAAAIPLTLPPLQVYFLITVILSIIGWTSLARVVRGRFLALKTEDFVLAAKLDGVSDVKIVMRHMVPNFLSHIIAVVTLAIPSMILAETALSFLGIGLRPPVVSWGVLLQEAQNIRTVASAPWLMWPSAAVVIAVLALNFLGDGLRDAADPYA